MRVIEVIIDGFKSYAVRTVIAGWDAQFNSITGLNGSGKSNILDAICFVLGITNMSTVRAQNLQDLIYKRGQAGVTKASVTIVFDNRDSAKAPIGFEEYAQISVTRQIVLGGTSKYLINGHRAQQATVQSLFQSVQLNIQNPNFLIMQGRITKVLNMKPVELLAMLEEAAGTRMFEERRDKAFKTMAKKETKVREIGALLADEIEPKLEKLRTEKRAFLDFQQAQSDVERLTRLVLAHDYVRHAERAKQSASDLGAKNLRAVVLEEGATRLKNEISHLEDDVASVKAARDEELRKGGEFQALEHEVKAQSHELVRLATAGDLKTNGLAEEQQRRTTLQGSVLELEAQLQDRRGIYEQLQKKYDGAKAKYDDQVADVDQKEELLQTLQTGVASREGQENGYQGQLQDARSRASAATTEQEQAKLKINHLTKRLADEQPRALTAKEQNADLLRELERLRHQGTALAAQLAKLGFEPGAEEALGTRETALHDAIRTLSAQADALRRTAANVHFDFTDPAPGFDRTRVKGLVAQLFTLDAAQADASVALEICAGSRLYNVVVDAATTGTLLLQHGRLRKRVTLIPLDRIAAGRAAVAKVNAAQKLAPGQVELALALVGYADDVAPAMAYVFGGTLVCRGAEAARRVTFDPAVRLKSVTLEGDVYDPAGTLSGGSSSNAGGVLMTLQKLRGIEAELTAKEDGLKELQALMATQRGRMDAAKRTKQELDIKTHEISLTEEQIGGNSSSSIIQAVEEIRANIEQLKTDITNAKARGTEAAKDIKRIERDMKDFSSNKDSKLAALQSSLDALRRNQLANSIAVKTLQKELQESRLESEQAATDLGSAREQLEEVEATLQAQQTEIQVLEAEQSIVKDAHDLALAHLADERAKLTGFDDELAALDRAAKAKAIQITEEALELQTLRHQIDRFDKEQQVSATALGQLEREHEWIAHDRETFGRPGSAYDFAAAAPMAERRSCLRTLTERVDGLKRRVNAGVMATIDGVEKKEAALQSMMRTVVRDKRKIEETITSLDAYKTAALRKTWTAVDRDFGAIFAELLPGSFAKLEPSEGKTIAEGLEVKVCLGKVWKQSLTELSGGQRSLIALSLILALLQFKPAPMYILDEVDAALDLSHTQNIGRLIKSRFHGSQFIVVSLKDGMFQNANRIFRTRFADGTSVVQALTPADLR